MPPFENDADVLAGLYGLSIDGDDNDESECSPVPLTGVKVKAQVHDFIAEIQLSQCYHNNTNKNLECIYHFPIYEGAAVCGFDAEYQDGSVVKGIVKKKETARAEYESAKRARKQANLLESVRRDVFTLSVGHLLRDMHVKITITYVTTLEARDDAAAFVLPTCIAPRYIPAAGVVPMCKSDARALAPPESNVKLFGLDITVDVTCRSNINTITCPTHPADLRVSKASDQKGCFSFKDIAMDRDVVVLIHEEQCHQPRASIEISQEDGSMTGFVTLYPQIEFPDQQREFVFVVDRSGSMNGQQILQARDTLLLFLRSLPASCTFNIVGFGSGYQALFDGPVAYNDDTLKVAADYAASMQADLGGTEILEPLRDIFNRAPTVGVEREVFVLTDGQVSNYKEIFDLIRLNCSKAKARVCRLFSVGIGQSVSRLLVSGMARVGRGTCRFVEDGSMDTLRVKVLGQLKQSMQPSLENVSIEWTFPKDDQKMAAALRTNPVKTLLGYRSPLLDESISDQQQPELYPAVTPPIFNKEKFIVYAMFASSDIKPDGVIVKCETDDGPLESKLAISADDVFHGAIAKKLAARTAISEYEDICKSPGNRSDRLSSIRGVISESEALRLALDSGLVSAQTSFIAVFEKPVEDPNAPHETKIIPQANSGRAPPSDQFFMAQHQLRQSCSVSPFRSDCSMSVPSDFGMSLPSSNSGARRMSGARLMCKKRRMAFRPALLPADEAQSVITQQPVMNKTKSDKVMQLCLLQKADGSFDLSDDLITAIDLTKVQVEAIFASLGFPDKVVFATVLALAVLRLKFAKKRNIWELQEQKVMVLHGSNPLMTELLSKAETRVRAIMNIGGI